MNLTKRVTSFFLVLLFCLALFPVSAMAAGTPIISYDRYDGVKTDAYEGEWSTYSVKVENVSSSDTVSYQWQFTIKCCAPTADEKRCSTEWQTSWFEPGEIQASWLRGFENSPSIEVFNSEGCADVDDAERYVYRCVVTVNGKEYKSPVFEQHCRASVQLDEIRAGGVDAPKANGSPDFAATAVTGHTSIAAVRWTYITSDGYYSDMTPDSVFLSTGLYQVRVTVKLDAGYRTTPKIDEPVKCYLNGTQCLGERPGGDSGTVVMVRTYEFRNGSLTIIPYEYDVDSLLAFDEECQYPAWDPENSVTKLDVVANDTETFQCAPKQLPDGAVQAGYTVVTTFRYYDGTSWKSTVGKQVTFSVGKVGSQLTLDMGKIGANRIVEQTLTLCKNGKALDKSVTRRFETTAKEGLPPKIYRFLGSDQYKSIGDSAFFYCKAAGTENQYLWMAYYYKTGRIGGSYSWNPVGSTGNGLLFEHVTKEMDGWIFRCRVTNQYGTTYSDEVTLHVSGTACDEVTITGITEPKAGVKADWYGASVTNGTGVVPNGSVAWVRATNPAGAAAAEYVSAFQDSVEVLEADESFRAGETYYALVCVNAANDYRYVPNKTCVTYLGRPCKLLYVEPGQLRAAYPFTLSCDGSVCPTKDYTDVPAAGHWAHSGIDFCVESGIMGSTKTDALTFEPNVYCTRSMIVSLLYRLSGSPAVSYSAKFPDVKDGQWYTSAVMWAYQSGVVSGYSDGRFAPNDPITREQMAVILREYTSKIAHKPVTDTVDLGGFTDAAKVTWSKDAVAWAVAKGIISGKSTGESVRLDPQGNATRAETASILMRFIQGILTY